MLTTSYISCISKYIVWRVSLLVTSCASLAVQVVKWLRPEVTSLKQMQYIVGEDLQGFLLVVYTYIEI